MILWKKNKSDRPRIRPQLSPADWILEVVTIILIAWIWGIVFYFYPTLPEIIPSHFNLKGEVDDYGNRNFVWFLPSLSVFIYALLTLINLVPHSFNYLVTITEQNAARQYMLATRMIRVMKLIISALLLYLSHSIMQSAIHPDEGPQLWFMPFFIVSLVLTTVVYFILSLRK